MWEDATVPYLALASARQVLVPLQRHTDSKRDTFAFVFVACPAASNATGVDSLTSENSVSTDQRHQQAAR